MRWLLALLGLLLAGACTKDLTIRDQDAQAVLLDGGLGFDYGPIGTLDAGRIGVDGPPELDAGSTRDLGPTFDVGGGG